MNSYPTIVPYQIGSALLPSYDWEGNPEWMSSETVRPRPGLDFGVDDMRWRSDLQMGQMTFSGKYAAGDVGGAGRELRKIDAGVGTWQPLIGYIDETDCENCDSCGCPTNTKCIRWVWTWAKLGSVAASGSLDQRIGARDAFSFRFKLKEPFRQATHHWWRWGSDPGEHRCFTLREVESQLLSDRRGFFPPCSPPSCSSPVRWHYKDWQRYFGFDQNNLLISERYSRQIFPGSVYNVRGGCSSIVVDGSYDPLCYLRVIISGDVTISNDNTGEMQFYGKRNRVYDQQGGYAYNGELPIAEQVPFKLGPGKNRIETSGQVEIGVIPRWLR